MKPIRRHLNYANVVATLALLFAMSGGALAADHYLINSTKQINPKVLRKLKGGVGSRGVSGPSGTAGATGATGGAGSKGGDGEPGEPGEPGEDLTAQTPLFSGETETGTFAAAGGFDHGQEGTEPFGYIGTAISYAQPLFGPIQFSHILFVTGKSAEHCPGEGEAATGYLCLYATEATDVELFQPRLTRESGVALLWTVKAVGTPFVLGEYAVTAP